MAGVKVTCKKCGKPFDWNDQWPSATKQCPYCGAKSQDIDLLFRTLVDDRKCSNSIFKFEAGNALCVKPSRKEFRG